MGIEVGAGAETKATGLACRDGGGVLLLLLVWSCAIVSPFPLVSSCGQVLRSNSFAAETKQEPGFTDEPQSSIEMIRYDLSGVSVGRVRHVCKVNPPQAQYPSQANGAWGPWGGASGNVCVAAGVDAGAASRYMAPSLGR